MLVNLDCYRFDFALLPIAHPRLKRDFTQLAAKDRVGPLTRSDLCLSSSDWNNLVVGKISPWLQLDSPHFHIRRNSEKVIICRCDEKHWSDPLKQDYIYLFDISSGTVLHCPETQIFFQAIRLIRSEPISDFCDVWLTGGSHHPQDRTSACLWKLPQ